ncbi:MAG: hypothetical protein CHACPFDD_03315 [Phycisphaerae bacterium]|nr:hypothetical protein [Phycisphaerae bacterium]
MFKLQLISISIILGAATLAAAANDGTQQRAGRPARDWVFFSDKGYSTRAEIEAAVRDLEASYPPRAVERRRARRALPGLFDERDLPVASAYVSAVEALGADVHVRSRWLNAVSVSASAAALDEIRKLPFVREVRQVIGGKRVEPAARRAPGGGVTRGFYGWADEQTQQINLVALHALGETAQGVIIGILDTGFQRSHVAFNDAGHPLSVIAEYDFVDDDANAAYEAGDHPDQHVHGTLILGTLGAYRPNELVGTAYDASFVLAKTEDITDEYPAEEDNYVAGLEFVEFHGADVATSSLGYIDWYTQADLDGQTAVTTVAVNLATANGLICCTAAGNSYHDSNPTTSSLIAPADAFDVFTCGAAWSDDSIADFSSDGPTADGRVKPEVLARGVNTRSVWPYDNVNYAEASGTSLSTPLVAGAVACLIGANPGWGVGQMREHVLYSAKDFVAVHATDPTFVRGYGVLDALAAHSYRDCNDNQIDDATDIANSTSQDVNGNGVPDECETGDMNCDGSVDGFDVDGFVLALTDPAGYADTYPECDIGRADVDGDGSLSGFDIDPFVELLTGG